MRASSNLKASGVVRPKPTQRGNREVYNSFRDLIRTAARLKEFGRGGTEKATRDLLGRVETIANISDDPGWKKNAADEFISRLGPSQQTAFRAFWSDVQEAATLNRQARDFSDAIRANRFDDLVLGTRKYSVPTLEDLGIKITPEIKKIRAEPTDYVSISKSLETDIKNAYDRFFTRATQARRKLLTHSDKLALMLTAAGAGTAALDSRDANAQTEELLQRRDRE